jgi:uncharacterized membrane protein YdjX (TVP38/TMEM64 family)
MTSAPPQPTVRSNRTLILVIVVLVLALLLWIQGGAIVGRATTSIREAASGASGPGSQLVVYALAGLFTFLTVLLPLPAEAAALLNGALFPPVTAFVLTWTPAMLGVAASYEIGRRCGRAPAARIFGDHRLSWAERLVEQAGWPALLGLRLSPVMAFTALNWASGILALSRPVFYWTCAVGLVPGTFVLTITPSLLASRRWTALLVGSGVAVAVGLVWVSVRRVRRSGRPSGQGPS